MKKKIMVFMLLFVFLVGVFGAVPVKAESFEHTIDDSVCVFEFNVDENRIYETNTGKYYQLSDEMISKLNEGYELLVFYTTYSDGVNFYILAFEGNYRPAVCYYLNSLYLHCLDDSDSNNPLASCYSEYISFEGSFKVSNSFGSQRYYNNGSLLGYYLNSLTGLFFSSTDVYLLELDANREYVFKDELYYRALVKYDFSTWCFDAGLNCAASSNESDSVIPFWYEPDNYNYIVRKILTASSTSGVYQMTMLQKTDGAHYPYYFEVNDIGYLGVAGAFSDISTFTVRNFYYDAAGNGWKLIERFDVSTLPFDNANVTFDENVVFIYSDTDIYADREASSIWQPASTEYYNVDIPEPEITRVPVNPDGPSVEIGGEAEAGSGLDFIITLVTSLWNRLYSIPMNVDGYSISLQQIYIYGILAVIIGAAICLFLTGRK